MAINLDNVTRYHDIHLWLMVDNTTTRGLISLSFTKHPDADVLSEINSLKNYPGFDVEVSKSNNTLSLFIPVGWDIEQVKDAIVSKMTEHGLRSSTTGFKNNDN